MTSEQWDTHWRRICQDLCADGKHIDVAVEIADRETAEQFGPRPEGEDA